MQTTMIRQVAVRFVGPRKAIAAPLLNPDDAVRFLRGLIGDDVRESVIAVYLDGRHTPIGWSVVSIGTATASLAHPREVFQPAIHLGACGVLVAHNHPSGDPNPSDEDLALTRRLHEAGKILGIQLLDHLVIGEGVSYASIRVEESSLFS